MVRGRRLLIGGALCLGLIWGVASAVPGGKKRHAPLIGVSLPSNVLISNVRNLIRVPVVDQGTDYTCGVAALQSVLYYYDREEDYLEDELATILRSDRTHGTLTAEMARFALSAGFEVSRQSNMTLTDLKNLVDDGKPVIVLLQAWRESSAQSDWDDDWVDGHFAVVIGYDTHNIYFMDPSTTGQYAYIPIGEFPSRWHDVDGRTRLQHFGMVITKGRPDFSPDEAVRMN